ncbi:MAG: DUF1549 domain-containing protein, partial [Verrucomicrobiales bacterium]|nr:DUF1549 domain-containing protein [Verrucomicrobiales bacterium]
MRFRSDFFATTVFSLGMLALSLPPGAEASAPLTFEKDVRPILKAQCFQCHGEDKVKKSGLDVRLRRFLVTGGKSGAAIVVGKPEESHLVELIRSGEMPKEKHRLSAHEVTTIEQWIQQGAVTARPEPETLGDEYQFTEEEREWWSVQPIKRPAVPAKSDPRERNAIDAFVQRSLVANGLSFSPEADAVTLIRRLSFDLTGLPPTPEAISEFVVASKKDSEVAYLALVEKLLASPTYGERWGRHWLDVAGYADSDGFNEQDRERKYSWRYRDYVIASLNADKPYNEFVKEQLAGDEMAEVSGLNANSPTAEGRDRYAELLSATGFLRMAADGTASENSLLARNTTITDTLKIVSSAFYGMTVQCAECHDHRYDPITQADFYELRAVFEPGFDSKNWRQPARRLVSLQTTADKATSAAIEVEAKKIDDVRLEKQAVFIEEVLGKELEKRDAPIREDLRKAFETVLKERTPAQVALLKRNPSIEKLNASSLYLYDSTYKTKHADTLKKLTEEATAVRATKPKEEFVQAFAELPTKPEAIPATFLFHRGNPEAPTDVMTPSDLNILASWRKTELPGNRESIPTSGRRLALAETLTDGGHPLLARVMVNRVWMQHFGTGLVKTLADFGALG